MQNEDRGARYTEEQVRAIIARAITRSDLEAALWSHEDLVQIAAELDIPERILEQAVQEIDSGSAEQGSPAKWKDIVGAGLVGGILGASTLLPLSNTLIPVLFVGSVSVAMALDARRRDAHRKFVVRNAALWGCFYGLIRMKYGVDLESATIVTGVCMAAGLTAMTLIRALKPQNPLSGFVRRLARSIGQRVRSWGGDSTSDNATLLRSLRGFAAAGS